MEVLKTLVSSFRMRILILLLYVQAWKKFDETKKRTSDILCARQRNMEIAAERAERQRQKEEEEALRQMQNRNIKDQIRA